MSGRPCECVQALAERAGLSTWRDAGKRLPRNCRRAGNNPFCCYGHGKTLVSIIYPPNSSWVAQWFCAEMMRARTYTSPLMRIGLSLKGRCSLRYLWSARCAAGAPAADDNDDGARAIMRRVPRGVYGIRSCRRAKVVWAQSITRRSSITTSPSRGAGVIP